MTRKIQYEIDAENDRTSRIEGQKAVMPPHQQKRLEEVQRHAELALARVYGHRLHPDIVKRIVEGLILDPEVLCSIGGGVNELPMTPEAWDDRMKEAVKNEPLAQICIDARDAELKEELRNEELSKLKPDEKIKMARARTLDPHLEQAIQARLEARRL